MNIFEIYDEFVELDLLEDRMEYSVEDFVSGYNLSQAEAEFLYDMVQSGCTDQADFQYLIKTPSLKIKSMLLEYLAAAPNQGWVGLRPADVVGFMKFIKAFVVCLKVTEDEPIDRDHGVSYGVGLKWDGKS